MAQDVITITKTTSRSYTGNIGQKSTSCIQSQLRNVNAQNMKYYSTTHHLRSIVKVGQVIRFYTSTKEIHVM